MVWLDPGCGVRVGCSIQVRLLEPRRKHAGAGRASPSILLDPHQRRHRPVRLGDEVEGTRLQIVAAENALVGLERFFICPLVALTEISPVAAVVAVVAVENLEQLIFRQTFRGAGGGVDLPEGKARFHKAVGHGGV